MDKVLPTLASYKDCTGCLSCVDSCPTESLTKTINSEGHFFYQLNIEKCIGCNRMICSECLKNKMIVPSISENEIDVCIQCKNKSGISHINKVAMVHFMQVGLKITIYE